MNPSLVSLFRIYFQKFVVDKLFNLKIRGPVHFVSTLNFSRIRVDTNRTELSDFVFGFFSQ